SLRTSLTSDTYYKYTELNSTNSAIALAVDATPIRMTPRFSMAPSAHFVQSQNSFRRNQLMPSGDPSIQPSIASESADRKSRDFGGALRVGYLVTPNTDFSVGGGFSKLQFLDNVAGNVDSRVVTGDAALTYKLTPLLSPGLFFNTARNTFESGRDSRTVSGGLTGTYLFSPALTMSARAGASRARETGQTGLPDRTTWSPAGSLSLTYAERDFRAALTGSVDQSGGGGFGLTTRRQSVGISIADRFAAEWTADLSGNFQQNRSLDAAVSEDLTSATGTAGIRYQVREWVSVRLSGTAFRQWSNGAVGTDLTRYSAFLGLTLGHTYNIY
ncbi:MAG: hypothetical protein M0Z38_11390, partial [Deltaproteobacteria bacterium]|nr:hypothetical protein [Deltaproteobacteria bacterium]